MKVGDLVHAKANHFEGVEAGLCQGYGLILEVHGGDMAKIVWQEMSRETSWEFIHDLVLGVEGELTSMEGHK